MDRLSASQRNTEECMQDVLNLFHENCVYTLTVLCIDMNTEMHHKWGRNSIRRALNELVKRKLLRRNEMSKTLIYYELESNYRHKQFDFKTGMLK